MRTNYRANSGVRFRMLSDDQLQELFDGVLHVLEYVGLEVKHDQAREILEKAGAWVDGDRVRLPSHMVKDALAKALRRLRFHRRRFAFWRFVRASRRPFRFRPVTTF